jgi:hypothetical protein
MPKLQLWSTEILTAPKVKPKSVLYELTSWKGIKILENHHYITIRINKSIRRFIPKKYPWKDSSWQSLNTQKHKQLNY